MALIIVSTLETIGRFWLARPPNLKSRISQQHTSPDGLQERRREQYNYLVVSNPRLYRLAKRAGLIRMAAKDFAQITAPIARVYVFEEVEYTAVESGTVTPRSNSPTVWRWRPPSATREE